MKLQNYMLKKTGIKVIKYTDENSTKLPWKHLKLHMFVRI